MNFFDKVSILIPVYNREKLVSVAIESAINQTYKNIEIIIGDNCSTDNTFKVIQEYAQKDSRIKIFQNKKNIGPVKNWRACLEKATGTYCKILFSDDLMSTNHIENAIEILNKNNDIGFVFTSIRLKKKGITKTTNFFNKTQIMDSKKFIIGTLTKKYKLPVSPCCAVFRTKDLIKYLIIEIPNDFNLNYPSTGAGNDLLIFLNISMNYRYYYYINKPMVTFFLSNDSITKINPLTEYYEYAKEYFVKNNHHLIEKKIINKFYTRLKFNPNYKQKINIKFTINFFYLINLIVKKLFKHLL